MEQADHVGAEGRHRAQEVPRRVMKVRRVTLVLAPRGLPGGTAAGGNGVDMVEKWLVGVEVARVGGPPRGANVFLGQHQ